LGLQAKDWGNPLASCLSLDDQLPLYFDLRVGVLVSVLRREVIVFIGGDFVTAACASVDAGGWDDTPDAVNVLPVL
jgi:hypothetical protein